MTEIYSNPRLQRSHPPAPAPPPPVVGLLPAITEFVKGLHPPQLQRVAPANAPLAYQPKVLLALLSFFYAHRVYPSSEIELAVRENHPLRALCGQEYADANLFRRFRRHNRDLIRECLAYALARSEGAGNSHHRELPRNAPFSLPATRDNADVINLAYLQEAERRIEQAVLLDSVDADL